MYVPAECKGYLGQFLLVTAVLECNNWLAQSIELKLLAYLDRGPGDRVRGYMSAMCDQESRLGI